jgi:putative peptide zinc metalloprotease protein
VLFGLGEPPPERLNAGRGCLLIGIFGIALFVVEIGWFVVLPVVHEVREWHARRGSILRGRRIRWSCVVAALLVLVLIVPWHSQVSAPAMLKADGNAGVYLPSGARLVVLKAAEGQRVGTGETLFVFDSPDAEARRAMIEARIKALEYQSQSIFYSAGFREQSSVIRDQLATAVAERASLEAEVARLTITAAVSGTVVDLMPGLHPDDWLSSREQLATIRGDAGGIIDAYVQEGDLPRIQVGDMATFYSDAAEQDPLRCVVRFIDRLTTLVLADAELASVYGGPIAVRGRKNGLIPDGAVYRVRLAPDGRAVPQAQLRGQVRISGLAESLMQRTARSLAAVVLREAGL